MTPQRKRVWITVALLAAFVLATFGMTFWNHHQADEPGQLGQAPDLTEHNAYIYDEPRAIRSFELTNEQGETVTEDILKGHWTIAFVGFTYCPDICPATMATLSRVMNTLSDQQARPRILFISADPVRDTPEQLERYISFFGDDFHGVTGDYNTLEALARDLNAVFMHSENRDGDVIVDHSSHLALIAPDGTFAGVIQTPLDAEQIKVVYEALEDWHPTSRS